MDSKQDSKVNVPELLKQLEKLQKQKAQKLRILKKLRQRKQSKDNSLQDSYQSKDYTFQDPHQSKDDSLQDLHQPKDNSLEDPQKSKVDSLQDPHQPKDNSLEDPQKSKDASLQDPHQPKDNSLQDPQKSKDHSLQDPQKSKDHSLQDPQSSIIVYSKNSTIFSNLPEVSKDVKTCHNSNVSKTSLTVKGDYFICMNSLNENNSTDRKSHRNAVIPLNADNSNVSQLLENAETVINDVTKTSNAISCINKNVNDNFVEDKMQQKHSLSIKDYPNLSSVQKKNICQTDSDKLSSNFEIKEIRIISENEGVKKANVSTAESKKSSSDEIDACLSSNLSLFFSESLLPENENTPKSESPASNHEYHNTGKTKMVTFDGENEKSSFNLSVLKMKENINTVEEGSSIYKVEQTMDNIVNKIITNTAPLEVRKENYENIIVPCSVISSKLNLQNISTKFVLDEPLRKKDNINEDIDPEYSKCAIIKNICEPVVPNNSYVEKNMNHALTNFPNDILDKHGSTLYGLSEVMEVDSSFCAEDIFSEDLVLETQTNAVVDNTAADSEAPTVKQILKVDKNCTVIEVLDTELSLPYLDMFIVPETEMFNSQFDEAEPIVEDNQESKSVINIKGIKENEFKYGNNNDHSKEVSSLNRNPSYVSSAVLVPETSSIEMQEDSFCENFSQNACQNTLMVEDTLDLVNYTNIPFLEEKTEQFSEVAVSPSPMQNKDFKEKSSIKLICSLHDNIGEAVKNLLLVAFNCIYYIFVQHHTWIQVWRQEENKNFIKIFSHPIDANNELKEVCCTKNYDQLALVMLLCAEQQHFLQFLIFKKDTKLIKLMEQTHWLQNRNSNDTVLLCGLEDMRFATAQGKETFEVHEYVFNFSDKNPRLMTASLGSTVDSLHSLCTIEKLPNALIGASDAKLYVWHLLEARLVTSVCLQPPDILPMRKCFWATIENGLVFFMTVCEGDSDDMCHLCAVNLATGFCQISMTYTSVPATSSKTISKKNLATFYKEPFLVACCEEGAFLWLATDELCSAYLNETSNVTAITIEKNYEETVIALGRSNGCVSCYAVNCA